MGLAHHVIQNHRIGLVDYCSALLVLFAFVVCVLVQLHVVELHLVSRDHLRNQLHAVSRPQQHSIRQVELQLEQVVRIVSERVVVDFPVEGVFVDAVVHDVLHALSHLEHSSDVDVLGHHFDVLLVLQVCSQVG